jgi:MscS family membrane protein
MKQFCLFSLLALTFVLLPAGLEAQDPGQTPSETTAIVVPVVEDTGPEDALNRGTPRGSILGYLLASAEGDFKRAAEFLDLRNLPDEVEEIGGPELARQLNHVLSRAVWLDDYTVSDNPQGLQGDGLPTYRDELVRIKTEDGEVAIWMQHVFRGDGEMIWKVSNRSVALIPELYELYSYPPGVDRISKWFPPEASFLGLEAFKWFIMIACGLLAWPLLHLLGIALSRLFSRPDRPLYPLVRKVMTGPLVAIGILLVFRAVLLELGMGARAQEIAQSKTLSIVVFIWAFWAVINLFRNHQQGKLEAAGRPGAARLMRPLTTFIKILVLLLGALFWLNNIGVNITTVLAGLGVGGLAVALALQRPLEDMMGALTIFSQAPFRVGDLVQYGSFLGAVEDIGLRTTRLRTLTNTVVSVPNALIAAREVENLSYRTKIRYWPTLRLRYDTTSAQLREITSNIAGMLADHGRVHDEPIRVRVTDLTDDAILVKVHSFLDTTDFPESLEIGEGLNLRIMEIVQGAGARFALPGRSILLEGDAAAGSG